MRTKKTDEERLVELEAKQAHLSKQLDGLWPHIKKLKAKIIRDHYDKVAKNGLTPKVIMGLDWAQVGNGYGDGVWEEVRAYMEKEWYKKGVMQGGYNTVTFQMAVKIVLERDRPLKGQMGISKWIPYIKPVKGAKYVGIFEHTLGVDGAYGLRIEDDKCVLQKTVYGHTRDLDTFDTLKKAMERIYQHHSYRYGERKEGEDY